MRHFLSFKFLLIFIITAAVAGGFVPAFSKAACAFFQFEASEGGGGDSVVFERGLFLPACALTVTLSASPSSGTAPLTVSLTADIGGTSSGVPIRYRFDCTNDGIYEIDVTTTADPYTATGACLYTVGGLTYTAAVRVDRLGDTAFDTVTIDVSAPPPPAITLIADPRTIVRGQSSVITWNVSRASDCTPTSSPTDPNWRPFPENPPIPPFSGSQTVSPSETTTYTLTCAGTFGAPPGTVSITIAVSVPRWREIIPRLFPFLERFLAILK